jgi:molybdopterin-containing oxidoreductase family iron-sulfur binding subunit
VLPVKQFSRRRKVGQLQDELNRLYVAEAHFTLTGGVADHRLRMRVSDIGALAVALAAELGLAGTPGPLPEKTQVFVRAVARDLAAHKGKSLVVAGPRQSPAVHALVLAMNAALGNIGQTITFTKSEAPVDSLALVKQLGVELKSGAVQTLVVLGGNPVYTLPADIDLAGAMPRIPATVVLSEDENETWMLAQWKLPLAAALECWGDARAQDGTISIQQPLIEPLFGGKSILEVAAMIAGRTQTSGYELVSAKWMAEWPAAGRETRWNAALYEGLIKETQTAPIPVALDAKKVAVAAAASISKAQSDRIEAVFYPSHSTYDGRYANNAWMQEAPDPMTKVVWDNVALVSKTTAARLSVRDGDLLKLAMSGRAIEVPAMIQPGHADNSISLALGYGRSACGRVGQGIGHRVEGLRASGAFHAIDGVEVARTGERYEIVTTQEHHRMEGRPIVREATLAEYRREPLKIREMAEDPKGVTLFPFFDYSQGYQWGMAIDLSACIGCNACLVACQAENNIPVVGKDQVKRGREMHWIRLDRYYTGSDEEAQVVTQPMACQQCENAPCESVCPVAATSHSPEGLNDMAYNRCVGTRYCLNNCPYKVRRFNFLNWNKDISEVRKLAFNPDVTVRMRGVMEKCNYCVQRIEEQKIAANADGRRALRDGEVVSACAQVCPAEAIVFGNINDPASRVAQLKKQERNYGVLAELNVRPRTSYLGRLRNPNPALESAETKEHA